MSEPTLANSPSDSQVLYAKHTLIASAICLAHGGHGLDACSPKERGEYLRLAQMALHLLDPQQVDDAVFAAADTLQWALFDRGIGAEPDTIKLHRIRAARSVTNHFRQTLMGYGYDDSQRAAARRIMARLQPLPEIL